MLLTPTYHVFEMYKVHQGVAALQMKTDSQSYTVDGKEISQISASASKNAEGLLHISLCNVSHEEERRLKSSFEEWKNLRFLLYKAEY